VDKALSMFSAVSAALPAWWLGIPLILVFAVTLQWFPIGGMYSAPPYEGEFLRFLDLLWHAILPVTSLVLVSLGPYLYEIRTVTLKIAQEDFVLYARARGFSEIRVRLRYILRPAAPVIVTGLLFGLAASFSGAIITEMVFSWPGMGSLYREAFLGTPDEGLIVSLTFVFMLLYVAVRFVLEVLYLYLDPRIRY
jgi:peptide/nickel transport system permease protein